MSENPYESPETPVDSARTRSPLVTKVELAVAVAMILIVVALLLPSVRSAREPARRVACMNNLKQIAIALMKYESANGALPPAYTVDAEGNRLHSWRTLILPYAEHSQLFESIDLSKPWDDPANAKAREAVVEMYWCPSASHVEGLTTYLAVVGPDFVFSGSVPRKMSEISDDQHDTIVVIDAGPDRAVHWMSPEDIGEEEILAYGPESKTNHPGAITVAFLDGSFDTLSLDGDRDSRRAKLTIAGGESTAE